jgi:hypothetical protein
MDCGGLLLTVQLVVLRKVNFRESNTTLMGKHALVGLMRAAIRFRMHRLQIGRCERRMWARGGWTAVLRLSDPH